MWGGYYDIDTFDYLAGSVAQAEATAQQATANVSTVTAVGTTAQVVGFDSGGNPQAKNVAGDSNGAGLAFSGDTLTATLSQNLQTTGSPTFSTLSITNLATVGDLKVDTTGSTIKKILTGTLSSVNPGSIAANTRGSVDATLTGVAAGDIVILQAPDGLNTGLVYGGCVVSAGDTVRIYLANITGSPIDDGANDWIYLWLDVT